MKEAAKFLQQTIVAFLLKCLLSPAQQPQERWPIFLGQPPAAGGGGNTDLVFKKFWLCFLTYLAICEGLIETNLCFNPLGLGF